MTDELAGIVNATLDAYALRGKRVAIALSGGVDSMALLDLLHELRTSRELSLSAIHVNHQISAHADEWETFCRSLCQRRGIPLTVQRVQVTPDGSGVEAAARRLRYRAYALIDADYVALAHHLDDQAETFLLQLLRGAGPKGLAGMPVIRSQESAANGKAGAPLILRPLLEVRRSQIVAYAKSRRLEWVEDDSNTDMRYDRNYLRNELLVRLDERFPAYRETLARTARNLADHVLLAEELARIDAQSLDRSAISAERLRQLSDARALNLLRQLFSDGGLQMPPRTRLEEALRQCREAGRDAELQVTFGDTGLRCYRDRVELVENSPDMPADWQSRWDGHHELILPDGLGVLRSRAVVGEGIAKRHFDIRAATVRGRSGGERMQPGENRPRRALKSLLQEHAIPPWERSRMPLVFFGEQLAWVPGIGVAAEFRAAAAEPGVAPEWEPG
ncbi:MAG: tRNA lysidine(34) synthetase TilS [Betaproteobacteria bacterium]|nr:tRNA lysidine(34) synthetase TilS [Betaproteobacteria bacterium]